MRAQLLGPLALLTPSTLANPLYPYLHPRQANSSTISLTSTGTLAAQPNDATLPAEPCIATHLASASTTCQDVATQYGIQLSSGDAQSLASSDDCKFALQGYRLCIKSDEGTAADTFPTLPSTLQAFQNATSSTALSLATEPTLTSAIAAESTSSTRESLANTTTALAPGAALATQLTTFTFTQGMGASASVREFVVTRIETESTSSESTSESISAAPAEETTSTSSESTTVAAAVAETNVSTSSESISLEAALANSTLVTAPVLGSSSTSNDGPVTMFSVSANVLTQSTTMINSYVDGDVTHVNEVVVMHVTTDYSTFFSTKTDPAVGNAAATETPPSAAITSAAALESSDSSVALTSSTGPVVPAALDLTATTSNSSTLNTSSLSSSDTTSANVLDASAIAADCTTVAAPAATQAGIVAGCAKWHTVAVGETCNGVAEQNGITIDDLHKWNTAIDSLCSNLWAGNAYCVKACDQPLLAGNLASNSTRLSNSTSAVTAASASTLLPTLTPSAKNGSATDVYKTYMGDGSAAAGWPSMSKWVDFDTMFAQNTPNMKASCKQWNVQENTDEEQEYLKSAILSQSRATGIDPRFILAITLQESTGCVRVITTAHAFPNPGLMQSHNGTGTCNPMNTHPGLPGATTQAIKVTDPCPQSEINQMIQDGVSGTASGDGLLQVLIKQGSTDDVTKWYRAARLYNGGEIAARGDLGQGCCTACYASDVANRLTGWVDAPSTCTLTLTPAARF